jgi:hypothetical protein
MTIKVIRKDDVGYANVVNENENINAAVERFTEQLLTLMSFECVNILADIFAVTILNNPSCPRIPADYFADFKKMATVFSEALVED